MIRQPEREPEVSLPNASRLTLEDVQFADLAEMVAVNRKGNGQWE